MNDVIKFSSIQKFKINETKTQKVVFNTALSKDFYPRIHNANGEHYNHVEQFKLLGVDFRTDNKKGVSCDLYINNCIKKAFKKIWILRRLAEQGVSQDNLMLTYKSRVRGCVEENAPLWMFSLTKELSDKIERVQKISFCIILGKKSSIHYSQNLIALTLSLPGFQ